MAGQSPTHRMPDVVTPAPRSVRWVTRLPVVLLVVVYLLVLGLLSLSAAGPGTVWWDAPIQRELRTLDGPGWTIVANLGNWLGETLVGLAMLGVAGLVCVLRHRPVEALLLGGVALIRSLNWPLKWLIDSPRPGTTAQGTNDVASGLGFPSGHAMGTMLIGGVLVVLAFRLASSPGVRVATVVLVTAAILACGYGRIVTRAHWPSDVAGGWLWGVGLLGIVVVVVRVASDRLARRHDRRPTLRRVTPPEE